ncbi:MAG: HNH endonuclease [Thermodesulfobacteriota bacterium]|nr:HNH endonuclease [Thermodesulfobacteriota bacterium]
MGISKQQREKREQTCQCGCNKTFYPFPVYGKKGEGLRYPQYIRGHHPNCRKPRPAWNRGLTKEVCPTLNRMGFQPGHKPFNDWSHVIDKQRNDSVYRQKWLASKKGQIPWNKGKTKEQYTNGIKSGPEHGNWCGGRGGYKDTAARKEFVAKILKRDNYTCQSCGDKNKKGRGSRCNLEVYHLVAVSENHSLALDPKNAITLCHTCHIATENYGTKLIHKRRKQGR